MLCDAVTRHRSLLLFLSKPNVGARVPTHFILISSLNRENYVTCHIMSAANQIGCGISDATRDARDGKSAVSYRHTNSRRSVASHPAVNACFMALECIRAVTSAGSKSASH